MNGLTVLKTTGMRNSFACSGKPEGISFSSTNVPVAVSGLTNAKVTVNGTYSVVIHSPCAWAGATASTLPFSSSNFTGKEASKYHVPRAWPVMVTELLIIDSGNGRFTTIKSSFEAGWGCGFGLGCGLGA